MLTHCQDFIKQLYPGSLVLFIGDKIDEITSLNKNLRFISIAKDSSSPEKDLQLEVSENLMKRPKTHIQIDAIICQDEDSSITPKLEPYIHPGGKAFIGSKEKTYFPEYVEFAKLMKDEQDFLKKHISQIPKGGIYVEIGSYKGGSSVLAAQANPDITIYCVDPWIDDHTVSSNLETWKRHTQYFNNVVPIQIDLSQIEKGPELIASHAGIPIESLEIDFLFIDGDHSFEGVMTDLKIYEKYTKKVSGHDFALRNPVSHAAYTYYAKGLKRLTNNLYNSIYNNVTLLQFPFRVLRRNKIDKFLFQPKEITHFHGSNQKSSIWYKEPF